MKHKCLILGGCGFIGLSLAKELQKEDYAVIIADKKNLLTNDQDGMTFKEIDFTSDCNFEALTSDMDVIIHAISTTSPRNFKSVAADFEENVVNTINLLDACVKNHVRKVVFLSSGGAVYGKQVAQKSLKEECAGNAISSYGLQKYTIEQILFLYRQLYRLEYAVCRIANIYGANQVVERGVGVIPTFIQRVLKGETIELINDGRDVRDYIYVDDVVRALVKIIEYRGQERVFNIGTGEGTSTKEILRAICKKIQCVPDIKTVKTPYEDVPCNVLDITKLKNELDFQPEISLDEGIERTIFEIQNRLRRTSCDRE